MTDNMMELMVKLHKDEERQGPGCAEVTRKAFKLTGLDKDKDLKIADIGCGTGAQTIVLAEKTNSLIVAIDLFPEFLSKLEEKAATLNLSNRITTKVCSMDSLPFAENEFDLIWSEGAIYNIGFEKGIHEWKRFIKPNGYLAVSEISWITNTRPKELEDYWLAEYSEIDTMPNKIKVLEKEGFSNIEAFILPQHCWIDNYYTPIQKRFPEFLDEYQGSDIAKEIVDYEKEEIRMYEKYKEFYSYGFYIARKI